MIGSLQLIAIRILAGHKDKMHSMLGEAVNNLLSDGFYLKAAQRWIESAYRIENSVEPVSKNSVFKPYKKRVYYISGDNIADTASQVAVSFINFLDGWPIMGPHKTAVHFSVAGEVIGYSKDNKIIKQEAFRVSERDLLSWQEALKVLEVEDGFKLDEVRLVRSEFGYMDFGKHSVRRYLAPHYLFVFESGKGSKVHVRPVCAIKTHQYRVLIDNDENMDAIRKQGLLGELKGDER